MQMMARYPDGYFQLAIVDPPYGLNIANMRMGVGTGKKTSKIQNRKWKPNDWDKHKPDEKYFKELFRVSSNQIIWGGNYFQLPTSKAFIIWDKGNGMQGRSFSECEYAWCNIGNARIVKVNPVQKLKFHPTQKPVALYKWLLHNYAKPGDRILDTHLGSASIAIACHDYGYDLTGCELDPEYFAAAMKRVEAHTAQQKLF